jgi:hypothetical protein
MYTTVIKFLLTYWKHFAATFLILYCGYQVYSWGYNDAEAKCEQSRQVLRDALSKEQDRREKTVSDYEKKLLESRPIKETIFRETVREVEKPVYRDCKVPTTGTELLKSNAEKLNELRKEGEVDPSAWKKLREKFKSEK